MFSQKLKIVIGICFLSLINTYWLVAQDVNNSSKIGAAINDVLIYRDSSHTSQPIKKYNKGAVFNILEVSVEMHEDAVQNQRYYWYYVRTPDDRQGWVFGESIAIKSALEEIEIPLKAYHDSQQSFNNGFEQASMWVGCIEGRDNFHEQAFLNPIYREQYFMVSNAQNKCVMVNIAGRSAMGAYYTTAIDMKDLTGDGVAELIFQRCSESLYGDKINKQLLVYTFKSGNLVKVFEVPLMPRKVLNEFPVLLQQSVVTLRDKRISVDYLTVANEENTTAIYNLELATTTYFWNEKTKTFENKYGIQKIPLKGRLGETNNLSFDAKKWEDALFKIKKIKLMDKPSIFVVDLPSGEIAEIAVENVQMEQAIMDYLWTAWKEEKTIDTFDYLVNKIKRQNN